MPNPQARHDTTMTQHDAIIVSKKKTKRGTVVGKNMYIWLKFVTRLQRRGILRRNDTLPESALNRRHVHVIPSQTLPPSSTNVCLELTRKAGVWAGHSAAIDERIRWLA